MRYFETWYFLKNTEYSRVPGVLIFKVLVMRTVNTHEERSTRCMK